MNGSPDLLADVAEVLLSEEQIQAKVAELGAGSRPTSPGAS